MTSNKINDNNNKNSARHIIFKLQKIRMKEKILKNPEQEKSSYYKEINKGIIGLLFREHEKKMRVE